jgi:hypothetical protein
MLPLAFVNEVRQFRGQQLRRHLWQSVMNDRSTTEHELRGKRPCR